MHIDTLKAIKDELEDECTFLEKFFTDEQERVETEAEVGAKVEEKKDGQVET